MNSNINNLSQQTTTTNQYSKKPTPDIGKLGFILSLISIPLCLISPTSLVLSCIGASYHRTKQTTAGIIISSFTLVLLLILIFFVHYQENIANKYSREMQQYTEYQDAQRH